MCAHVIHDKFGGCRQDGPGLRTGILPAILLAGALQTRGQLLVLGAELVIGAHLLAKRRVRDGRLARHGEALAHRLARRDALPPRIHVREGGHVDAGKQRDVDPGEAGNVGDGVAVADEEGVVLQARVEHAVQALRLADVALRRVGDALGREAVEVVGLALHLWGVSQRGCHERAARRRRSLTGPRPPCCHAIHCSQRESSGSAVKLKRCSGSKWRVKYDKMAWPSMMPVPRFVSLSPSPSHVGVLTKAAAVMVDEHGDAAVGPLFGEPRLLLDVLANVDALHHVVGFAVGGAQLFEEDGRLVACAEASVGGSFVVVVVGMYGPLGVPAVRSSRPLVAMRPVGRDILEDARIVSIELKMRRKKKTMTESHIGPRIRNACPLLRNRAVNVIAGSKGAHDGSRPHRRHRQDEES